MGSLWKTIDDPAVVNNVAISEDLEVYEQVHGEWGINNAGIVKSGRDCLLIDTAFTEARATQLCEYLSQEGSPPVSLLVNTHHHGDHTNGNYLFPDAAVIGHTNCRKALLEQGASPQSIFASVDFGDIEVRPPSVVFDDSINIFVDDLLVELRAVGYPAHTDNDIVAWVPDRGTLFCGDLLFNGVTPFLLAGSVTGSLAALDWLSTFGATHLVPGHGATCTPKVLESNRSYYEWLLSAAETGLARGLEPMDTASEYAASEFEDWLDPERCVVNLVRAYAEIDPAGPWNDYEREELFRMMAAFVRNHRRS